MERRTLVRKVAAGGLFAGATSAIVTSETTPPKEYALVRQDGERELVAATDVDASDDDSFVCDCCEDCPDCRICYCDPC